MFRSDFRKREFVLNLLQKHSSEQGFGKWMDFQISLSLWELQIIRDWLCVRDIGETSLNRLLLLLILKSSHRSCSVEKGALKNFTGKHLCWSLFIIELQVAGLRANFANFEEHLFLRKLVFSSNFIYNSWKRYSYRDLIETL